MIDILNIVREKQIKEEIREESRPYLRIPEPPPPRERVERKKEEPKRVIEIQL